MGILIRDDQEDIVELFDCTRGIAGCRVCGLGRKQTVSRECNLPVHPGLRPSEICPIELPDSKGSSRCVERVMSDKAVRRELCPFHYILIAVSIA
jgi:hypothetical protein